MNLISRSIFVNSHTSEVIVEIAIYEGKIGFEIIRRSISNITGVIKVSKDDAIEYYNNELIATKKGLTAMETIYEIRN